MTKKYAPATERNREPIRDVLKAELPDRGGLLLEIAAGTGEHATFLSRAFPQWQWQPTDPDPDAIASIAAWRDEQGPANLLPPLRLDASEADWPVASVDAVLCVNMTHISPPSATEGLFAAAGRSLGKEAPLLIYGPFLEAELETTQSNLDFDVSLNSRNPEWGLRDAAWLDRLAGENGLRRTARYQMPANNLTLVYRKT
ncbi:DUF938 domain-containing protein [Aurantiacibacter zhengii]|uniref:DUF938 domain-containing protein n=1 Tax=Aurantiacibacter zhengii TaxID=2307003 RepID=A0A418NVJ5_9SPHN|nr:DUF938 domain-containing protein [Aurantiacibacter zhengii]RIV88045.1 DUF938 domain-containing protein [Aurantiacibacter zhengii]